MLAVSAPPEAALSFAVSLHLSKKDIANTSCLICKKKQSINHAKPPKAGKENDASGEDAERERRGKGDDQVQPAVINCQER